MKILSYLVLAQLLIKCRSQESNSSAPRIDIISFINRVCASIDECKPPCCLLTEIYAAAKNRCTTNIDRPLLDLEWTSPFSAAHAASCRSACPYLNDGQRIDQNLFQSFVAAKTSKDLCTNITQVCYDYSLENIYEFAALDFLWGVFVPVATMGTAISLMIVTLLLYLLIPELRRRIQDKCFLFYLSSRIVYLSAFFVVLFTDLEGIMCTSAAFMHQFSGLASEFWLNIICFHLWRCIGSIVPPYKSSVRTMSFYSAYAWGFSLFATVITHLADMRLPENSPFRPGIGEETCTIRGYDESKEGQWFYFQPKFIYFYSITIVTQIMNLCAFIHIAYIISSKDKALKSKDNEPLRRHQIKHLGIFIYLKLFLLMGLIRILDMIFLHCGDTNLTITTGCFLNGVFVTVIFVCNKRVFRLGKSRFSRLSRFS